MLYAVRISRAERKLTFGTVSGGGLRMLDTISEHVRVVYIGDRRLPVRRSWNSLARARRTMPRQVYRIGFVHSRIGQLPFDRTLFTERSIPDVSDSVPEQTLFPAGRRTRARYNVFVRFETVTYARRFCSIHATTGRGRPVRVDQTPADDIRLPGTVDGTRPTPRV